MRPIVQIELPSSDNGAAMAFYRALCGWQGQELPIECDSS